MRPIARAQAARPAVGHHEQILLSPLGLEDLAELLAERVAEIIASQPPPPRLIDRNAVARELGISPSYVSVLVKQGLPHVMAGEVLRFELESVLTWLRERTADQ